MKKTTFPSINKKFFILLVILLGLQVIGNTNGWANLNFVKPQDASRQIEESRISDIPKDLPYRSSSRAPESTTLALFGSGMFGLMISILRRTYALAKRALDIFISIISLILLFPLIAVTAIVIKLTSKGPIFFRQIRVGKNGELFDIYKFRTMKVDAERETGPIWATLNDTRLIPIGNLLRKTHIDEIPQFINVLKGEMSVIGPRPERPVFVQQFKNTIIDYEKRLEVKPGITGLAQVWHKYYESIEDVRKKIKYDLLYIKKICFWTDFRILLRTVKVVITGEGAR